VGPIVLGANHGNASFGFRRVNSFNWAVKRVARGAHKMVVLGRYSQGLTVATKAPVVHKRTLLVQAVPTVKVKTSSARLGRLLGPGVAKRSKRLPKRATRGR
jgi:hypothetical protein